MQGFFVRMRACVRACVLCCIHIQFGLFAESSTLLISVFPPLNLCVVLQYSGRIRLTVGRTTLQIG
jgi:hypothetical protein